MKYLIFILIFWSCQNPIISKLTGPDYEDLDVAVVHNGTGTTTAFVGDSRTRDLPGFAFPTINFSVGGMSSLGAVNRERTFDKYSFDRVLIAIGYNDTDPETFRKNLTSLISYFSGRGTTIYLQNIVHCRPGLSVTSATQKNALIDQFNAIIAQQGKIVIDLNSVMIEPPFDYLAATFTDSGGVHFTASGYAQVKSTLSNYLQ